MLYFNVESILIFSIYNIYNPHEVFKIHAAVLDWEQIIDSQALFTLYKDCATLWNISHQSKVVGICNLGDCMELDGAWRHEMVS